MRLIAALFWLGLATASAAAPLPLATLSAYLNSLTTVEAPFTQINPDGTLSTGIVRIARPGRIRFEYDPPDRTLVISDGQQVAVFDAKSNQPPQQYPLRRTPLHLILAPRVDLGTARMVIGHREDGSTTRVTAQDPDNPGLGTIEMVFSADPVELRQWVVTDDAGGQTTLILGEIARGVTLGPSLFSIEDELRARGLLIDR
jgi:outer membrane lipoprotein-sorting protein